MNASPACAPILLQIDIAAEMSGKVLAAKPVAPNNLTLVPP